MARVLKYHGLGNDFALAPAGAFSPEVVPAVCDRHRGVGADGVIFWSLAPQGADHDATMVIYNQDGSRPEMCGNGIRCLARMLADEGLVDADAIRVETDAGVLLCELVEGGVRVEMGPGALDAPGAPLSHGDARFPYVPVDMGNPHAVVFAMPSVEVIDDVGARANDGDPRFPEGVNVEFVDVEPDGALRVVVYERGVGRTQACGTGACAVAVAAWDAGKAPAGGPTRVLLPGGPLEIGARGGQVLMTGPAARVFEATLDASLIGHDGLTHGRTAAYKE
jgi:diaminopimelate epimerase